MLNKKTTGELVAAARDGDSAAFEELYRRTAPQMMGLAVSMLKNEQDALDILQESYVYAYGKLDALEQPDAFSGWLYRLVANRCKNYLTRTRPKLFAVSLTDGEGGDWELEDDDPAVQPEETVDAAETGRLVREMIDSLPEDQRICVLLHYFQDKKIAEIAEILDIPENTVKSRLGYARKKLRAQADELARRGVVLHGVAFAPLLFRVFAESVARTLEAESPVLLEDILQSTAVTTTAATGAASGGTSFLGTVAGKVTAGIVAAALAVGGAVALLSRPEPEPEPEPEPIAFQAPPVAEEEPEDEEDEREWRYIFDEELPDQTGGKSLADLHLHVMISEPGELYRYDPDTGEVWVGFAPGDEFQVVLEGVGGLAGNPVWDGGDGVLELAEGESSAPVYLAAGEGAGTLSVTLTAEGEGEVNCRIHISVPGAPPEPKPLPEPEPEPETVPEPEPEPNPASMSFLFLDEGGNAIDGVVAVGVRIGGYTIVLDDRVIGRAADGLYSEQERANGQTIITVGQAQEMGLVQDFVYTSTSLSFHTGEDVFPTFYYDRGSGSNSVGRLFRASSDHTVVIRSNGNNIRFDR